VDMGRTLHRLATDSVYVEYDCGHNNLTGPANTADYWRHIADFLKEHGVLQDVN
jgi:aspartate/tyrosine/aromatic aminotransferase